METNLNIVVREIKNKEERNTAIMNQGAMYENEELATGVEYTMGSETPNTAVFYPESPDHKGMQYVARN